jgi:hypothetical protein
MSRAEILAAGFGLSGLIFAPNAAPMLVSVSSTLFHEKYSLATIALGVLVDFSILGALCSLLVLGISRISEGVVRRLGFVLLISVGLRFARHLFLLWISTPKSWVISRMAVYVLTIALVILAIGFARQFYSALSRLGFLLPGIGIFAIMMVLQLVRFAVASERVAHLPTPVPTAQFSEPALKHRVVWILYDELSYREVYERAAANGLSLPAFASVTAESVSFRNVVPAAFMTEWAIPSLFLGETIDDVKANNAREISIRLAGKSRFEAFDPQATIFGELHRERLNAAIIGWYSPYCDLFASVVPVCHWESDLPMPILEGMSGEQGALQNAMGLARDRLQALRGHTSDPPKGIPWDVAERQRSYSRLMTEGISAIGDPTLSLVFIHLPVPHPPGFYNRHAQTTGRGTYLDNLVLTDRSLQTLFNAVLNSTTRDITTVIVTSDHSWRIGIWKRDARWSKEEAAAAPREFDPRIPLLVHFPNEKQAVDIGVRFEALRTRSLISEILHRQLETPDGLRVWAGEGKLRSLRVLAKNRTRCARHNSID